MTSKELLHEWEQCRAGLRKLAEAIPPGKESLAPVPGAMSLGDHVLHIASSDKTAADALTTTPGKWDWDTGLDTKRYPKLQDILTVLDEQSARIRAYLSSLTDAALASKIKTPWGETTVELFFFSWITHEAHHRGSLVTSLRVAGVTPPNIWG